MCNFYSLFIFVDMLASWLAGCFVGRSICCWLTGLVETNKRAPHPTLQRSIYKPSVLRNPGSFFTSKPCEWDMCSILVRLIGSMSQCFLEDISFEPDHSNTPTYKRPRRYTHPDTRPATGGANSTIQNSRTITLTSGLIFIV